MCRSIKTLLNKDSSVTDEQIQEAALQFVRKISGMRKPSMANEAVSERGVDEVAEASKILLHVLIVRSTVITTR